MRKSAALIVVFLLPFIAAVVLLRIYFAQDPLSNESLLNFFVEMPPFGRMVVDEFKNLNELFAEIKNFTNSIPLGSQEVVSAFASGDIIGAIQGIFNLMLDVGTLLANLFVLGSRAVYYICRGVGLLLTEPINMVVYFISIVIA